MKQEYKYEQNAYQTCTTCDGLGDIAEHSGFVNPGEITDKGEKCTACDGEGKTLQYNFFKPNDELAEHLLDSGFKKDNSHSYKRIFTKGKFSVVFDHMNIVISVNAQTVFWHPVVYLGTLDNIFYGKKYKRL